MPYSGTWLHRAELAPYTWEVNGVTISNDDTPAAISSGGGLTATSNGSNTLIIGGTPSGSGSVSLSIKVKSGSSQATATYSINIVTGPNGANNSHLKGQYTCLSEGFKDSDHSRWASLSTFTANGSGALTGGVTDENGSDQPNAGTGTLTGTYSIGADNNGIANITTTPSGGSSRVQVWAIALTGSASPAVQFPRSFNGR